MIPLPIHYVELEAIYGETIARGARTVAFTAAEAGEGVSTLAYALARRSAAAGRKTLLVDLNLHHPSVGEHLAISRQDWTLEDDSAEAAIEQYPGLELAVLAAPAAAEGSLDFRERKVVEGGFDAWLKRFDVVVADTSPVHAGNRRNIPADLICAVADATVLVVLAGRTPEDSLRAACERLTAAGAKLVGCVFNDRFNPTLGDELRREIRRFEPWLPGLAARLQGFVEGSAFLNAKL